MIFSKISKACMIVIKDKRGLDFTISDVARNTSMTRVTLYKIWEDLVNIGVIEETRKIGTAKLYRLDENNEITKALINLYKALLVKMMDEQEENVNVIA